MHKIKLPYGMQDLDKADFEAVVKVLESDYLATGPMVPSLKIKLKTLQVKFAIACSSGTSAFI